MVLSKKQAEDVNRIAEFLAEDDNDQNSVLELGILSSLERKFIVKVVSDLGLQISYQGDTGSATIKYSEDESDDDEAFIARQRVLRNYTTAEIANDEHDKDNLVGNHLKDVYYEVSLHQ